MKGGRNIASLLKEASAIVKVAAELADDPNDVTRRALEGAVTIIAMAMLFLEEPTDVTTTA